MWHFASLLPERSDIPTKNSRHDHCRRTVVINLDVAYDSLMEKLTRWLSAAGEMFPNLLLSSIILILFWYAARFVAAGVARALRKSKANRAARDLMCTLLRVAIVLAGVMVALGILQLDKALASVLAGAGVVGLALGFAFQDLAANLISGVGLAINREKPFKIGDIVETNDEFGKVTRVDLRTSTILTLDGKLIIIPNKKIYQEKLVNHSVTGKRRVDLSCGISYGDPLEKVKSVVERALRQLSVVKQSDDVEPPRVLFTGFGDSSIDFVARFWVDYDSEAEYLDAKSQAIMAIKRAFDDEDIVIPFPIRTLDFGIRGGKQLHTQLSDDRVLGNEAAE